MSFITSFPLVFHKYFFILIQWISRLLFKTNLKLMTIAHFLTKIIFREKMKIISIPIQLNDKRSAAWIAKVGKAYTPDKSLLALVGFDSEMEVRYCNSFSQLKRINCKRNLSLRKELSVNENQMKGNANLIILVPLNFNEC